MKITVRISDWYNNLSFTGMWLVRTGLLLIVLCIFVYIFFMPLKYVPQKMAIAKGTPAAEAATKHYWEVMHSDDWQALPGVIDELTAAYEKDKTDHVLISVLGGAHLWRFSMRNRFGKTAEELADDLIVAERLSKEVIALTDNARESTAPSMLATAQWQLDVVRENLDDTPNVHINILENSIVWPQFAAYMQGWILGAMLDSDNPHYSEVHVGYDFMLNSCAGLRLPDDPKFTKFIHTLYGLKSLTAPECYNNPMAPHSIAGTMISIGDIYLKAGDHKRAMLWYNNTKVSPNYGEWPYQHVLEQRMADLDGFQRKFKEESGKINVTEPAMSYQSEISCGICHSKQLGSS